MSPWKLFFHSFKPGLLKLAKLFNASMQWIIGVLVGCKFGIAVSWIIAGWPDGLFNGSVEVLGNILPFWGMVVCFLWMLGLLIMPRLVGNITVTDAVWLILDWEVIWHKNHLLCTVMGPEPSTLTLYCLCGSISTMAPNLCQLLSVICSNWWSYI